MLEKSNTDLNTTLTIEGPTKEVYEERLDRTYQDVV